ncbi:MAG: RluA family pseudouridine synthase [Alphaproteobacteria bacterium]
MNDALPTSMEEWHERLLYRDGLILIINKPAGLPVHAGSGGGANLEQFLHYYRFGLLQNPSLAHRLDRDTSGCLVLGRHRKALQKMGKLFSSHQIKKNYLAVVEGKPEQAEGVMNLPLAKISQRKDSWRMMVSEEGQEAITDYKVIATNDTLSVLSLFPRTGRTHQLRVHCAHMGYPIVGDALYNPKPDNGKLALHAFSIEFPLGKTLVQAEAPLPPIMLNIIEKHFPLIRF